MGIEDRMTPIDDMSQRASAAARLCWRVLNSHWDGALAQEARDFLHRCSGGDGGPSTDFSSDLALSDYLLQRADGLSQRSPWALGSAAAASFALLQNAPNGLLSGCVLQGMA